MYVYFGKQCLSCIVLREMKHLQSCGKLIISAILMSPTDGVVLLYLDISGHVPSVDMLKRLAVRNVGESREILTAFDEI